MDMTIIDKLYDDYNNYDLYTACNSFKHALRLVDGGGRTLINNLTEYINSNTTKFPTMFATYKNAEKEDEKIANIVTTFKCIASMVDDLFSEYRSKDAYLDEHDDYIHTDNEYRDELTKTIEAHDLFNINETIIKQAYKKYGNQFGEEVTPQAFKQVLELINFIKEKGSIKKVFGSNDWKSMDFKDVIYTLYDYHKRKDDIFNIDSNDEILFRQELESHIDTLFRRIAINCNKISTEQFDKYRTSLITNKTTLPNLDKLIFCKNLLSFYKTGLMPDVDGYLDPAVDSYEEDTPANDLTKIYNSRFDEGKFMELQADYIFDPNAFLFHEPQKVEKVKGALIGESMALGILLSSEDKIYGSHKTHFLIHIFLKDVKNDKGTYEIQFNLIPQGKIKNRIQLVRLDNWETKQVHKNIGEKLQTTAHIHLYNHFDLLRGKEKGAFDIAYNVTDKNIEFNKALEILLSVIDLDADVFKTVCDKVLEIRQKCLNHLDTVKQKEKI